MSEKKYVIDNKKLMAEWDVEKNQKLGFYPDKITCGSNKKAWWKCSKEHEWQAAICSRNMGSGCPYCSGNKVLNGYNDLKTVNPILANEWNYKKNGNLTPELFTASSKQKVWWKCSKEHEWQASINSRSNGRGCPYCSNKKVLKGVNDLQTLNPDLASEWNYEKNGQLSPTEVLQNSHKKIWWRCNNGHCWEAIIADRNKGNGCPYCSGRYSIKGRNDLLTVNPILANEWNYEKNNELTPKDVLPNSDKKVWWRCKKGHEWLASIGHRSNGRGCPICDSERKTSMPEYAIVYYLKKHGIEVVHSYKELGYELDVFLPTKKIAIEYDGSYWHKNRRKKDLEKNQKCKTDGIKLYRIRDGLPSLNDSSIDYIIEEKQKDFCQVLEKILSEIIGKKININLEKDSIEIENLRDYTEKNNSLLMSNPEVAKEWNYAKNGSLTPQQFFAHSNKKVWWKCKNGHEWQANINDRNRGRGCPFCASKKILQGYNDLATINPSLANEWNYEKNDGLKPIDVLPNSHKQVWWKCKNGHEWQAVIKSRNNGNGCPYCYRLNKHKKDT